MSLKLRDHIDKNKMTLTRKQIRNLLYEIFNISKNEQNRLEEKRKTDNSN